MRTKSPRATYTRYAAWALTLALGACATPEQRMPPGTRAETVRSEMGQPSVVCPLPDGGERWVWSGQPFMQASWATNVKPDGTTSGIEQVLTDASFSRLRQGNWHIDQVRCTWGPPGEISGVGWGRNVEKVWSYSYRQDGVWNSLMHVYFDDAGYVTRFHPGPDPLYEPDRFLPLW